MARQRIQTGVKALIERTQITGKEPDGEPVSAAVDVVAALAATTDPAQCWADLKEREPALAAFVEHVEVASEGGQRILAEAVRIDGLLRLVQSIPSAKAERIKQW